MSKHHSDSITPQNIADVEPSDTSVSDGSSHEEASNYDKPRYMRNDSKERAQTTLQTGSISMIARRPSFLDDEEQPLSTAAAVETGKAETKAVVTWSSLPKKGQLAVLVLGRLSEPLSERSLAAYMFYQLKWFDPSLPDSTIASQGGLLTASFAAAQFLTAVWWGRAADTPWIGRKRVILIGLTGTAIASLGVGFSKSFYQAVFFRALAGALNGNVGVMRTMLSEIIKEKKYQSRAFLLLPMCFNIGVVIGPILGGFLADPIHGLQWAFGPGSWLGGKEGVSWMRAFPYAFPNLFSGVFIAGSALAVVLGLDETHEALKHKPDAGRRLGKYLYRLVCRRGRSGANYEYAPLANDESEPLDTPLTPMPPRTPLADEAERATPPQPEPSSSIKHRNPFKLIVTTPNVLLTITVHFFLALHIGTFNSMIFLFLPAPWSSNKEAHLPLFFTGGLGLTQSRVGIAMAILGVLGLPLQILLYPPVNARLGTLPAYRTFLPFSILAYTTLPFLSLLPQSPAWLVWVMLTLVLGSHVLSRTFVLTGQTILVNNCSLGREMLGTVHGVAQSVSSGARMLGPTIGGMILGWGLKSNFVGCIWWIMAVVAGLDWILLWFIYEGDGMGGRA